MAITSQNWTLPGVETILGQSAIAINEFTQSALNGTHVLTELAADVKALQAKEQNLLAKFGGLNELKNRIARFKADANNFAGKGLRLNFTIPYETAMDNQLQKAQKEFEIYIVNYLKEHLAEDIFNNLNAQDLFKYLNLQDLGLSNLITVIVSEKGATVKGLKRSGGQVGGKKDNRALSEFLLKDSSSAVVARIGKAVTRIKKDLAKQGIDLEAHAEINQNRIKIYSGTKWAQLTSQGGVPLSEKTARKNPEITKNINNINRQIKDEIRTQLGINLYNSRAFDLVMNHMLNKNPYMFFVGKNVNQITGLIGEITAMILFYDLIHAYPSIEWAAQHTGLSGTQASADIIIDAGYGIQVKNSTTDFGMIENTAQELTIGFSNVSFDRLGDMLHFNSEAIEDLYDTQLYNVSYTWGDGSGTFTEGSNKNFDSIDNYIDTLIKQFEVLMSMYSSSLLYMDDARNKGLNVYSGDVGNVLYMVNLVPYLASDMLQKIINAIEGRGNNPLIFTVEQHKDLVSGTIVDDINPNPHTFFSGAGSEYTFGPRRKNSRYLKTSYNFT